VRLRMHIPHLLFHQFRASVRFDTSLFRFFAVFSTTVLFRRIYSRRSNSVQQIFVSGFCTQFVMFYHSLTICVWSIWWEVRACRYFSVTGSQELRYSKSYWDYNLIVYPCTDYRYECSSKRSDLRQDNSLNGWRHLPLEKPYWNVPHTSHTWYN
jgi:hypothetical protein